MTPPEPPTSEQLVETLRDAQRLGFFGAAPIDASVAHARAYLAPLRDLASGSTVYDLGSGGGLPGLVIAEARPDLHVVMIDRRQKRTDFLRRSQLRLGLPNVSVRADDVGVIVGEVATDRLQLGDAVTARGFGPPGLFLATASALLRSGGRAIVSEPPTADRWNTDELRRTGFELAEHDPDPNTSTRIRMLLRCER